MSTEHRPSDTCAEYVTRASTLVGLDAAGMSESPQADDLRDVMDGLWLRLSPADQAHVRTLLVRVIEAHDPVGHDPGDEDRR